jgi:hypothetical protein
MSASVNHRTYERIPFSQKVKVVSMGRMVAYAVAINIGMGGVLLNATSPLPMGSQCRLAIPVPGAEGMKQIITQGTVVRSDAGGIAVQFAKTLERDSFDALFKQPAGGIYGSILASYKAYFQVSQNKDLAGCEKLLGVSKRTFRTTFYISFFSCISTAILAVWMYQSSIPPYANWVKVVLCFGYGAIWLTLVQPSIDLTVFHFLRQRQTS